MNLRTRRTAAAAVLAAGVVILLLATVCSPNLRAGCILFGLILTLPALLCLGVDLILQRAVRALQEPQSKKD